MSDRSSGSFDARRVLARAQLPSLPSTCAATTDSSTGLDRLKRWKETSTGGDQVVFERRLSWDEMSQEDAAALVVSAGRPADDCNPELVTVLEALVRAWNGFHDRYPTFDEKRTVAQKTTSTPIPFQEVLLPPTLVVMKALLDRQAELTTLLTHRARKQIEFHLLRDFSASAADTLELEFTVYRHQHGLDLFPGLTVGVGENSSEAYGAFVQRLFQGQLTALLTEYPGLAHALAVMTQQWLSHLTELLERLSSDRDCIAETIGDTVNSGPVTDVRVGLSDRHGEGRSVAVLTFESGQKVVYKPKPLKLEALFGTLLQWIQQEGGGVSFMTPRVLDCGSWGWVEYVEHRECETQVEVRDYYERLGAILAVLYVLRGTDVHRENLIASGPYPVVVDLETLMTPQWRTRFESASDDGSMSSNAARIRNLLLDSVLETGVLPSWRYSEGEGWRDFGGMGGRDEEVIRARNWHQANRDHMVVRQEDRVVRQQSNRPRFEGRAQKPQRFLHEFLRGFQLTYCFLANRKQELAGPGGRLHSWKDARARFVFRPTQVYSVLLTRLRHPETLRSGVHRWIELGFLDQACTSFEERPAWWPVVAAERDALQRGDVPLFHCAIEGTDLMADGDVVVADAPGLSGYEAVQQRVLALSKEDAERQCAIARACVLVHVEEEPVDADADGMDVPPLDVSGAVEEADAILAAIRTRRLLLLGQESSTWIGLHYSSGKHAYTLEPIGDGLYNGALGLAVFAAALDAVRGDDTNEEFICDAVAPCLRTLQRPNPGRNHGATGSGLAEGLGSNLYGLTLLASLRSDERYLRAAEAAIEHGVDASNVGMEMDLLGGAAGLLTASLAVYEYSGNAAARELGIRLGQRVSTCCDEFLASSSATGAIGFAHGLSGCAFALTRLFAVEDNPKHLQRAAELIALENQQYSRSTGAWETVREEKGGQQVTEASLNWCRGSAGIGLSRLALMQFDSLKTVARRDLEGALTGCVHGEPGVVDQMCCGAGGRWELMLSAGNVLGRPELLLNARQQAGEVIRRSKQAPGYRYFANLPHGLFNPGLFQGAAGLGYQLLRLLHPEVVPNLLLFETVCQAGIPESSPPQLIPQP